MKISVAMATYNGEFYVSEQIRSILQQTNPPDEIIIVDDASTDNTIQVLSTALAGFSNARIIVNKNNLGYSSSFFKALSECTGDLIFISDQDDCWEIDKVNIVKNHFTLDPDLDIVIHDAAFYDSMLNPVGNSKYNRIQSLGMSVYDVNVTGMCTTIRGRFMKSIQPDSDEFTVAYDEWIHTCGKYFGKKKIIYDKLVRFRRHEDNATIKGYINTPTIRNYLPAIKHFLKEIDTPEKKPDDYPEIALHKWIINSSNPRIQAFHNTLGFRRLETSCALMRERLRIRKMPLLIRFFSSVSFLLKGGYQSFRGYRSFLKDMISHRSS